MSARSRLARAVALGAPLAYMGLIFLQSCFELPAPPPGAPANLDKLAHLIEYGLLALLLHRGIVLGLERPGSPPWLAAALATLYGLTDELHQSFVPGRDSSWGDAGADLVGALLGAALAARLLSGRASRSRAAPGG